MKTLSREEIAELRALATRMGEELAKLQQASATALEAATLYLTQARRLCHLVAPLEAQVSALLAAIDTMEREHARASVRDGDAIVAVDAPRPGAQVLAFNRPPAGGTGAAPDAANPVTDGAA